ncbi:MAG TPA: YggS family pyridoxal phosphate-dependent enzyme [Bryobacteraceae bacterium]|nr:YggS family pyridoxal phosphate-dependent enzyme [Bryobacteraceae bacterium]
MSVTRDRAGSGSKEDGFEDLQAEACATLVYRLVLQQKLEQVESRIADAAARSGRRRSDITLVAVTKKFPAGVIREAYQLGLRDFGENYVQEFELKQAELAGCTGARYHLIGHLQSNKSKKAAEIFDVIQTVDTAKLARRLEAEARTLDVMIEVRLSEEESKAGAAPEVVAELADVIRGCAHLRLLGLMTMPPWSADAEKSRPYFSRLRALGETCGLPHLSMGMSHDLEVAIEEGATMVRVGTALFGPRKKN